MDKDLKNKTFEELERLIVELEGKKYLAKYAFSFIHAKDAVAIEDVTPLPKELRQRLITDGYYISQLKLLDRLIDPDGTEKFLFELADGARIESVLMTSGRRKTLCISPQAGCRMGCEFCATGKLKLDRNLTAGEIADQLNQAARECGKINNVVYMGMGEPMDNYDEVMRSVHIINHHAGKYIGQRHITISTCGIPEGIVRFAEEKLQVHLSISLHSTNDAVRAKIMRIAKKYPIDSLIKAVRAYQKKTGRRVMIVYCMIKGINDSDADARSLAGLLKKMNVNVNLIEYNPHTGCNFEASSRNRIQGFLDILMQSGIETTVRYKRGRKIKAACGQLAATRLQKQRQQV